MLIQSEHHPMGHLVKEVKDEVLSQETKKKKKKRRRRSNRPESLFEIVFSCFRSCLSFEL